MHHKRTDQGAMERNKHVTRFLHTGDRQSGMPRRVFSEGLQKRFAQSRLAIEAGMAALRWLAKGYGYDITGLDVWKA